MVISENYGACWAWHIGAVSMLAAVIKQTFVPSETSHAVDMFVKII